MMFGTRDSVKGVDRVIILSVGIIFIAGLFFLYSASGGASGGLAGSLVMKQLAWMAIGFFIFVIILLVDYQKLIDIAPILYALNILLLILVLALGAKRLGAQRWLAIGGFGFQPSEFIKVTFILVLASYLGGKKNSLESPASVFLPLMTMLPAFLLIVIQPDLGTALILIPILFSMLFIAGANLKSLLFFFGAGILSTPLLWNFLKDYQKKRLLVFINPNLDPLGAGYTITQSKIAIGSGYITGKGWLAGTQSQLNFLPERHTDFIFSVIGEEWGFIGSVILITLYLTVISRGLKIVNETPDTYGKCLATGVVAMLSFQTVVNIGMTLGLLPVVGLTLPFISYGGSSLVVSMAAIGLLLNVGMRRSLF